MNSVSKTFIYHEHWSIEFWKLAPFTNEKKIKLYSVKLHLVSVRFHRKQVPFDQKISSKHYWAIFFVKVHLLVFGITKEIAQ